MLSGASGDRTRERASATARSARRLNPRPCPAAPARFAPAGHQSKRRTRSDERKEAASSGLCPVSGRQPGSGRSPLSPECGPFSDCLPDHTRCPGPAAADRYRYAGVGDSPPAHCLLPAARRTQGVPAVPTQRRAPRERAPHQGPHGRHSVASRTGSKFTHGGSWRGLLPHAAHPQASLCQGGQSARATLWRPKQGVADFKEPRQGRPPVRRSVGATRSRRGPATSRQQPAPHQPRPGGALALRRVRIDGRGAVRAHGGPGTGHPSPPPTGPPPPLAVFHRPECPRSAAAPATHAM